MVMPAKVMKVRPDGLADFIPRMKRSRLRELA